MGKYINIQNQKFGKLIVIERAGTNKDGAALWRCKCDCGNEKIVRGVSLICGNTKSCGCMYGKHKHTSKGKKERIYTTWTNMKQRCLNNKSTYYKNYGARGIMVCEQWKTDFVNFYNWAISNGYNDNLTIDRIDPNGNYEPNNCRFVNMKKQNNNRTNNHFLEYKNYKLTIKQWSEKLKICETTIQRRLAKGWTIDRVLKEFN